MIDCVNTTTDYLLECARLFSSFFILVEAKVFVLCRRIVLKLRVNIFLPTIEIGAVSGIVDFAHDSLCLLVLSSC